MNEMQMRMIQHQIKRVLGKSTFYQEKFAGIAAEDIKDQADFEKLPFSSKEDLRNAYPLGLQAVDEKDIVRIHSSSGTTGMPVIIPYTQRDIDDWALMFRRCYEVAGITNLDRIQITPGYGLWTAGIGFQTGAELLGAMVVPMGPGNTEKQIQMMLDLQTTVLCSTSSYALFLAEEIKTLGLGNRIALKKGVIGSERWGKKMRERIASELHISLYDIYGLTEIYGPGISISCDQNCGLHYWDDYLYLEVIDPDTEKVLPQGEEGELVITTLKKEGAPLLRYRTRDITRLIQGECPCGLKYPRHDVIVGRTDDMTKVKGVNIYPGQIDEALKEIQGVSSEYQVIVDRKDRRDFVLLRFELENGASPEALEAQVKRFFKSKIGLSIEAEAVPLGSLPRSEKKSKRIFDNRI